MPHDQGVLFDRLAGHNVLGEYLSGLFLGEAMYRTGASPLSSMVIMGSLLHRPAQPDVVTAMSFRPDLASSSRITFMMGRAPAAMPQVPMWTVILTLKPPSRRPGRRGTLP